MIGADSQVLSTMALVGAALGILAMILFGIVDLALGLLRPRRNRRWLAAALLLFPVLMLGTLIGGALLLIPDRVALGARLVGPAAAALCAAMIWWSLLPQEEGAIARLFD
jgi:hypothetical protein